MKKITFLLFAISFLFSCASKKEVTKMAEVEKEEAPKTEKNYTVSSGTVNWTGSKMAYDHNGTINISEGKFTADGHKIKSGEFTINMKSLNNVDLKDNLSKKANLEGHLKSADFFDVEKFPTAHFVISSVKEIDTEEANYTITGLLTLKGVSKEVSFPALVVAKQDGTIHAISDKFKINRSDWGIIYGRGVAGAIGDKIISDQIGLQIILGGK